MRDLASGPRRFVELQRVLPGISTEQLRSRLNRMVADGMLTRKRFREVPPRVDYELTQRATALMPVLGALARWGYDWAWGAPREGESIDPGAIFRLAPGLVTPSAHGGAIEFVVNDGRSVATYTVTVLPERVTIAERYGERPDARVSGDRDAWVIAFTPARDRSRLQIVGDAGLATRVLDALAAMPAPPASDCHQAAA